MNTRLFLSLVILSVITGVIPLNLTHAWQESTFSQLQFDSFYAVDVHLGRDGDERIALRARPSRNIFVLDSDLNVVGNFDPLSDTNVAGGAGVVTQLRWNPFGTQLAVPVTETYDGSTLQIWDVSDGIFESFHFEPIADVKWNPRGETIAVRTEDRVIIWDVFRHSVQHEITLPGIPLTQNMDWKSDGSQIAILNAQGVLWVWDVDTGSLAMELNAANIPLTPTEIATMGKALYWDVEWQPGTDRLALISQSNETATVEVWDTTSANIISAFPINDRFPSLSWGHDGLAIAKTSGYLQIWDVTTEAYRQELYLGGYVFVDWFPEESRIFYVLSAADMPFSDLVRTVEISPAGQ